MRQNPDEVSAETDPARGATLEALFDAGTFVALDGAQPGARVGWGAVAGRRVFAYAHAGAALTRAESSRIARALALAAQTGSPVVGLLDATGARVDEGLAGLGAYAEVLRELARAQTLQIAVVAGPCVGLAALAPPLADVVLMVEGAGRAMLNAAAAAEAVTGVRCTDDELGGADVHAARTGLAHLTAPSAAACIESARGLLALLPAHRGARAVREATGDSVAREAPSLDAIVARARGRYDVRDVIAAVVDGGGFVELHVRYAPNVVCALARLEGRLVGVVASQPAVLAGCLDAEACTKASRFVALCDRLGVALLTLVDTPGFLPGDDQEHGGIAARAAGLLRAYATATVPRVTVVLRRAYGGAYAALASRLAGADVCLAWPLCEVAVTSADGAVSALYADEIARAEDPAAERAARLDAWRRAHLDPQRAVEAGHVDAVIAPRATRRHLCEAFARFDRDQS
jgi:acetyl-CoA carboxylase carboxyltransferase component